MTSPTRLLVGLLTVMTSLLLTLGRQVCEHCDCQISSAEDVQAVYSLSLVCNAGTITWFGADGGVRLELTPFVHSHFRACFMAESINTQVKISKEISDPTLLSPSSSYLSSISYSPRHNYQLKRIQKDNENAANEFWLEHLLTTAGKSKEFCLDVSPGRPLQLFLETAPSPGVHGVPKVKFHYDVTKLSPETPQDPMD
ncbi:meteorin-like protein, partial [Plakobranchus ocellatus]